MKILTKTLLVIVAISFFTSCASIVSKSNWPLTITTNPSGANVEITDKKGTVVYYGTSPAELSLRSGAGFFAKQTYKVKLTLDGYGEKIIPVECELNGWYVGNILFGGLIGMLIVDPATGAMYRLDRKFINTTLTLTKPTANLEPSLKIINIKDVPENLKAHLVCIK